MRAMRWTLEEAAAVAASPDLHHILGAAAGVPILAVDVGERTDESDELGAVLADLPIVAMAVGAGPHSSWDLAAEEPGSVIDAVLASPNASVIAAQVLRGQERRNVADGLLVESLAYAALQGGPEFASWLAGRGHRVRRDLDEPRIEMHDHGDSVAITLNRPRLHNLMDAAMRDQLVTALQAAGADPSRAIVVRANGPTFCGGGDLAEFGTVNDAAVAHLIRSSANVAPALVAVRERTTVEIEGPAVGAGVELAAFGGHVRAAAHATFRLPEVQMGLIPGAGGTVSIPARIGRQRTLQWLLSGAELDAPTAFEWGLVDELI
jgi:hypothetical protein